MKMRKRFSVRNKLTKVYARCIIILPEDHFVGIQTNAKRRRAMTYGENELICKCKKVTYHDIEVALHTLPRLEDVEKQFSEVQKITNCSTGCGGCHNKILDIISEIMAG